MGLAIPFDMSNPSSTDKTIEIRLSVRRDGVWKDIVKAVDASRVLDEARKLSQRSGAREMRIGGADLPAERAEALPRWVWHVEGIETLTGICSLERYWGLD